MNRLAELDGKTLGCWCAPNPCHGDVLVRLCEEAHVTMEVLKILAESGLRVLDTKDALAIHHAKQWANHPLWLAHAT